MTSAPPATTRYPKSAYHTHAGSHQERRLAHQYAYPGITRNQGTKAQPHHQGWKNQSPAKRNGTHTKTTMSQGSHPGHQSPAPGQPEQREQQAPLRSSHQHHSHDERREVGGDHTEVPRTPPRATTRPVPGVARHDREPRQQWQAPPSRAPPPQPGQQERHPGEDDDEPREPAGPPLVDLEAGPQHAEQRGRVQGGDAPAPPAGFGGPA